MAKQRMCPMCGEPISREDETCPHCGEDLVSARKASHGESDATGGVIPYKNVPALIGYYCAVFSLIPCLGAVLGFVALGLGIAGLRTAANNPAARGQVHAWIGIILGGLCALANWGILISLLAFGATRN